MQKKWFVTLVGAAALFAAGCGDDDEPNPDSGVDARVIDSGMTTPDTAVPDAAMPDAQLPTHGATVVVSELHVYTGLNTFINIPSTSVAWNRVDAAPASAVKTGNPLANPVGQCVGLAFNLGTGVVPNPNTGNAGTVTIK